MKADKSIGFYVEWLIYFLVTNISFLLLLRKIRSFFSGPPISANKIIGYSQYFGYPYTFETAVFFYFVVSPIIIYFLVCARRKFLSKL